MRGFAPQGLLLFGLLLGSMLGAEAIQTFQEVNPDCSQAVERATAECESEKKDAGAGLKDACGTVTYSTTMTTVTRLKHMASHQTVVIKSATSALESAKSAAASMAKQSGTERQSMLKLISKQKSSKTELHTLKTAAHKVATEMQDLKVKADRATEAAVQMARDTSNMDRVGTAKRKAHSLYQQYVDYEVKMASAQRKVHIAKEQLRKITTLVETEITRAKSIAEREASALKTVATKKMDLAVSQQKQADLEVEANQNAERAAIEAEHTLKQREEAAANDISQTRSSLQNAESAEKKADESVEKVRKERPKSADTRIDIRKLEKKAEAIAKGEDIENSSSSSKHKGVSIHHDTNDKESNVHITIDKSAMRKKRVEATKKREATKKKRSVKVHTHGAGKDVHEQYAAKVEAIEKQRVEAADNKAAAVKELRRLESTNASAGKISAARLDVKTAQATVDRLVDQQNAAVAAVVSHIRNTDSKPQGEEKPKEKPVEDDDAHSEDDDEQSEDDDDQAENKEDDSKAPDDSALEDFFN